MTSAIRYLLWEYDIRQGGTAMTGSERDLGMRWFEQVWNPGQRETTAEMMSPDAVLRDGESTTVGRDAFYSFFDRMRTTFSEMHAAGRIV
jgi:SnoaL-like protein